MDGTVNNSDAYGHTVTATATPTNDTDRIGLNHSLAYNGSTQYLTVTANSDFTLSGDFTLAVWCKTTVYTQDTHFRRIISGAAVDNNAGSLSLTLYNGAASPDVSVYTNSLILTGNISIADGNWHLVVLNRSGTDTKLWVDGVQSGSTKTSDTTNYNRWATINFHIGAADNTPLGRFNGSIGEVIITKSYVDAKALYNITKNKYIYPFQREERGCY
jgi:hypothetical protein